MPDISKVHVGEQEYTNCRWLDISYCYGKLYFDLNRIIIKK